MTINKQTLNNLEQMLQQVIGMQHHCNAVDKAAQEISFALHHLSAACIECKEKRNKIEAAYKLVIDSLGSEGNRLC